LRDEAIHRRPAALFVAWWSTRSGRLLPATIGALLTSAGVALFFVRAKHGRVVW